MSKVVKFGGSSLASAEQFRKVGEIIKADPTRKYVVPSAPGKRFKDDTKVTDMLYACYDLAEQDKDFSDALAKIAARYQEIIDGLGLELSLEEEFSLIEKNFKEKAGKNYAASRGEYLNGIIMADYLGFTFIDAATVIKFTEDGMLDADLTDELLSARLADCDCAVVPGFYGSMPDGTVRTFSRGGSDITGSIVAKAAKVADSLKDQYLSTEHIFIAIAESDGGCGRMLKENGITKQTMNNYMRMADMIPELEDLVDTGIVTKDTALAMIRNLSSNEQRELIASMDITKKITKKEMKRYIDEIKLLKKENKELIEKRSEAKSNCSDNRFAKGKSLNHGTFLFCASWADNMECGK